MSSDRAHTIMDLLCRLENIRLWARVRDLAILGTVPVPDGRGIPGLFDYLENDDVEKVCVALGNFGCNDLAEAVSALIEKDRPVAPVVVECASQEKGSKALVAA